MRSGETFFRNMQYRRTLSLWSTAKLLLFTYFFMGIAASLNAQLITTPNNNAQQLAQALMGGGISISNVSMNCPQFASGTFQSNGSNIGLPSGVLLTSGSITNAPGPNNAGSAGNDNFSPGDAQLNAIATGNTQDACALEFDFVANCDTIQIAYVFASEEYPEFVNASVNDLFAFFLSGPGYVGAVNIATIPGRLPRCRSTTSIPVTGTVAVRPRDV